MRIDAFQGAVFNPSNPAKMVFSRTNSAFYRKRRPFPAVREIRPLPRDTTASPRLPEGLLNKVRLQARRADASRQRSIRPAVDRAKRSFGNRRRPQ
jgi:hypothetical protein